MDASTNPTMDVARRLCELCSTGQHLQAMEELYADDARHIEALSMPGMPQVVEGKQALTEAAIAFFGALEFHGGGIGTPYPHGDQFIVEQWMDYTAKEGPMAGQRMEVREMALYTVRDGKIAEARFFYDM